MPPVNGVTMFTFALQSRKLLGVAVTMLLAVGTLTAAERFDNPDEPVTIRGQVVDENDRPVAEADVWVAAPAMGMTLWWMQEEQRVRTGEDGQFKLTLPFGDVLYHLQVQRLGFDAPWTPIVATPEAGKKPIKLRIRRGLHTKL